MSDFLCFLYDHYIRPCLAALPMDDGDSARRTLLLDSLDTDQKDDLAVLLRFHASQAFLLGLRTGAGLAREGVSSPAP